MAGILLFATFVQSTSAAVFACLLGTIVGDSLGLPYEGLSPRRAARLLGPPTRLRLLGPYGMVSDDTEHAVMTARALARSGLDSQLFVRSLAKQLKWWFLALPPGLGFATLRACFKLCLGFSPARSGVFSAGNGPCMRAPVLGAAVRDLETLHDLVLRSTRLTHTDPKAFRAAYVCAVAAHLNATGQSPARLFHILENVVATDPELWPRLQRAAESASRGEPTAVFAAAEGMANGVSGYCHDTVPIVIHAWLSHPNDPLAAAQQAISCGGDADTTAAIAGGIAGASGSTNPAVLRHLESLKEWPWTPARLQRLANATAEAASRRLSIDPGPTTYILRPLRNMLFLLVVLALGFRRLAPPY